MLSRRIIAAAALLAVANALVFGARAWLVVPAKVDSASMEPTLDQGDRVLVNRRLEVNDIERGDIIVIRSNVESDGNTVFEATDSDDDGSSSSSYLVKRVIGLPGETIQGAEQIVAINRTNQLSEPWAVWGEDASTFGPVTLASDELWVMGDQRSNSIDSRDFGAVPASAVVGSASFRFWPLSSLGAIE